MRVTMVKKRLASGEACRKCIQTEAMLKQRGLWDRIDAVVVAQEGDPESPGMQLAARHGVDVAPFFIVTDEDGDHIYTSALKLIKHRFSGPPAGAGGQGGDTEVIGDGNADDTPGTDGTDGTDGIDADALRTELADRDPADVLDWALRRFGVDCAIAFSGAEDVVLIDMASKLGAPFSVFCLDTGRLHPETYQFIDKVRDHYGVDIRLISPSPDALEPFVRRKGLFSFYQDGHAECCGIRKVAPLDRALTDYRAWVTGQRSDQNPETRADVPIAQRDGRFSGRGGPLLKLNPIARWTSQRVWDYIRAHDVPYNPLHSQGFISIGCAPCTRPVLPGQHERDGRWWWERTSDKECGLHVEP